MSDSLRPHGLQPARLLCPWGLSRQGYWKSCLALLQGIFPTQRLNPGLPHCRRILYHLSGAQRLQVGSLVRTGEAQVLLYFSLFPSSHLRWWQQRSEQSFCLVGWRTEVSAHTAENGWDFPFHVLYAVITYAYQKPVGGFQISHLWFWGFLHWVPAALEAVVREALESSMVKAGNQGLGKSISKDVHATII